MLLVTQEKASDVRREITPYVRTHLDVHDVGGIERVEYSSDTATDNLK